MALRGLGIVALCVGLCQPGSTADLAGPRSFNGQRIVSIRFEPSAQPLPLDYLYRILPLKQNATFDLAEVRGAIQRLYATGRYADIAADGEPSPGGVAVTFHTTDQWFVGFVDAVGKIKTPPNRGQIANASRLELGQPFIEDDLKQAAQRVENVLRRNGFYEAKVTPHLTRDPKYQQVNIAFDVNPGKRARFSEPVITGRPLLPAEEVSEATKWKWNLWKLQLPFWKQATQANVNAGVQNVRKEYAKKQRLSARVAVTDMRFNAKKDRVTPVLDVVGGPKVKVETVGAKLRTSKLKEYVPIWDEDTIDRDLLTEGARNLRDYYQNEGYFDVEVDFQQKHVSADQEEIVYVINLGRRQKVVNVAVQGNHYFSTTELRERMFIQPAGLIRLRHGRYSAGFVKRDTEAITSLYQANGFRDVKVDVETIDDYKGKRDEMAVIVHVAEGPQYVVSNFTLNGVKDMDRQQLYSQLSSVAGEPFSEINIGLDRSYVISTYNASGFPEATFTYTAAPGPKPNTFNVTYNITEGPRRYVRDLVLSGVHETRMRLIQPTIRIRAGDPLSLTAMTDMQHNLYDLGIFDQVNMAVQNQDGDTPQKYVLYQIQEGHRYQIAGGFGAELARIGGATNDWSSPGGATGFSPRVSLEVNRFNLWGLGHSVTLQGTLSSLQQTASLSYLAPRYRNVDGRNVLFTGLYDDRRDVRTFNSLKKEVSSQLSQKLSKASTVLWRLTYRDVSVSHLKVEPLLIPLLTQPVQLGLAEGSFLRDTRDDPTDAHRGMYTTVNGGLASSIIGSRRNFTRFLATNAGYYPFHSHWVLARRLEFGWIRPFRSAASIPAGQEVPLPERFFSGGSTSLRGFPDNQAGPRDPFSGFPLGGNALLVHNTELRFPFLGDNINGVLFHDMGNIYSNLSDISFRVHQKNLNDFNYMVHAVGFGIRYRTPIGPVRVDLAYSINPPQFFGFKGTTLDVLRGTAPRVTQSVSHFQFFISIGQAF